MTYATLADLTTLVGEAELVRLTDRADPPGGQIDTAVVDRALRAADGEIDSYIGARYSLPLATVPEVLKDKACDIAFYKLHTVTLPEDVAKRYDDAIAWLKSIAAGRASLGVDEAPASGGGMVMMEAAPRVFGRSAR